MDKLIISGPGFPGTNKTWRFLQSCFSDPLTAIAFLTGDTTILSGVEISEDGQTVSSGFICYQGEILLFQGGAYSDTVTIVQADENVNYKTDINGDVFTSMVAYVKRYATCGSGGAIIFDFEQLTRLRTIKQLSSDIPFTQVLLDKLNGIAENAEVNVQADWNVVNPASDAFIKNKPTNMLTVLRRSSIQIGDVNDASVATSVTFPTVGTSNYMVLGAYRSNGDAWSDAGVIWITKNHTPTSFLLINREIQGQLQNLSFHYILIPA